MLWSDKYRIMHATGSANIGMKAGLGSDPVPTPRRGFIVVGDVSVAFAEEDNVLNHRINHLLQALFNNFSDKPSK